MAFVNCQKCGAEMSDDRKSCPHCGTEIVPAQVVAVQNAANDKERGFIQQIIALDQENTRLVNQANYLKDENNRLHSENQELRKQIGGPPPAVEHAGPGVVPNAATAADTKTV